MLEMLRLMDDAARRVIRVPLLMLKNYQTEPIRIMEPQTPDAEAKAVEFTDLLLR